MFRRRPLVSLVVLLAAATVVAGPAFAGIGPSPFHLVISNRTNQLDASSPFRDQSMSQMVLTLWVAQGTVGDNGIGTVRPVTVQLSAAGNLTTLDPDQTIAVSVDSAGMTGPIVSWSFKADIGIGPSPFDVGIFGVGPSPFVFAFASRTLVKPAPYEAPALPASYLTGDMPIMGFASPGVIVGTVAIVGDRFYAACPSIPATGYAWKNHGQYVRCVAQQADSLIVSGLLSTEDADAIVSAAAQSETGKK